VSDRTDPQVIAAAARAIRELDRTSFHARTDADQAAIGRVRTELLLLIDRNGFDLDMENYRPRRRKAPKVKRGGGG
jgi:hypothetical protein